MTEMNDVPIEEVLSRYQSTCGARRAQRVAGGFSGAIVVRVDCDAGVFCLRGWPPGELPAARILGLHRLLAWVFERGVTQVAVPIRAADGATLVPSAGRWWQLEPWMPGKADFHRDPSDARLTSAMRCLAAFHRVAATFEPTAEESAWFASHLSAPSPAVVERLERIRGWNGDRLGRVRVGLARESWREFRDVGTGLLDGFACAAPNVADQLRLAATRPVPLQPCLRDVWHDHLLFTGDEVTGLIDASACRSENVAADLARLLGSLLEDDRARRQAALDEYGRSRPLSLDEEILVEVLDRSGVLLSAMTWLERRYLVEFALADWQPVLARLRGFERRLRMLVESLS